MAERRPELAGAVRREQDPAWAANQLARALLADELDRSWIARLPADEQRTALAGTPRRLEIAEALATEVLADHPSSWEAALVIGGARYLRVARRLENEPRGIDYWERPLLLARELGPGRLDPERLLAAAYVSQWASLDAAQRERAPEILRSALRHQEVFDSLIEPWLRVAPSRSVAFSAIPEAARAWSRLEAIYARREEWARVSEARSRWYGATRTELEAQAEAGRRRIRTGDSEGALRLFAQVARNTPREASFGSLLSGVIVAAPEGWTDRATAESLRQWLTWAVERSIVGRPALEPHAIARLIHDLELPPALAAAAALLTGQEERATFHERRSDPAPAPEWLPYLVLRSAALAERSRTDAVRYLERVPPSLRQDPLVRLARARLDPGNPPPPAWQASGEGQRLALIAATPAQGLELRFASRPAGSLGGSLGGSVEIRLDGRLLETVAHEPGARVSIRAEIGAGPHLVELVHVAGAPAQPGAVSLLHG